MEKYLTPAPPRSRPLGAQPFQVCNRAARLGGDAGTGRWGRQREQGRARGCRGEPPELGGAGGAGHPQAGSIAAAPGSCWGGPGRCGKERTERAMPWWLHPKARGAGVVPFPWRGCRAAKGLLGCPHASPAPGDAPVHLRVLLRAPWLLQDEEEEGGIQRGAGDGGVRSRRASGRRSCRGGTTFGAPSPLASPGTSSLHAAERPAWPGESRSRGMAAPRGTRRCCGHYLGAADILHGLPKPSAPQRPLSDAAWVPAGQRIPP